MDVTNMTLLANLDHLHPFPSKHDVLTCLQNAFDSNDTLKHDKETIILVIGKYDYGFHALKFLSDVLKGDKELVMLAVTKSMHALEYASNKFNNDEEIMFTAVKYHRMEALGACVLSMIVFVLSTTIKYLLSLLSILHIL